MSADLKAIQERAETAELLRGAAKSQPEKDRAALLEHIARQSEVVRMLTEALAPLATEIHRPDWDQSRKSAVYFTEAQIAQAHAALKAAAEGATKCP